MKKYAKSKLYAGEEAGGQGMTEYTLILGTIVSVGAVVITVFRDPLIQAFTNAGNKITNPFTNAINRA